MNKSQPLTHPLLSDPSFIKGEVLPVLNGVTQGAERLEYQVCLVDTQDPTKITAEYALADGNKLFAKVYSGGEEDGGYTYQVMKALWDDGFDTKSRYRVAEPLAYFPERCVLLVRGVQGVCLVDHLGTNNQAQFEGVREAARWLARLHSAPVFIGRPWQIWQNYYRLGHRLIKATSRRSEYEKWLRELLDKLTALAASAENPPRLVQTHGQFRDLHVFISDDAVSVIDLDRSLPADPAKDLDEFLHRLRWKTFKHTRQEADELTRAFIQTYTQEAPQENLTNLPFYWAYHALYSLARFIRSKGHENPDWNDVIAFYTAEFELAVNERLAPLTGGPA